MCSNHWSTSTVQILISKRAHTTPSFSSSVPFHLPSQLLTAFQKETSPLHYYIHTYITYSSIDLLLREDFFYMAREFATCVEYGLSLSKRIYYGKEMTPAVSAAMTRSMSSKSSKSSELAESYLPTAVMAYAVVPEPELVDNPDVPSYQPYVHGRCEPPALIPLQMHGAVAMEIDCCFDHANVCFSGAWRVHCIKASRKCDVRIAVPMGEQVIY